MIKTTKEPEYIRYVRRNSNFERVYADIDFLIVPSQMETASYNPFNLVDYVNELVICNLIDGKLEPDLMRTTEIKKRMIRKSPSVMRISKQKKLFVKGLNIHLLQYFPLEEIVKPGTKFDYIATKDAAQIYAKIAGICPPEKFDLAEERGKLTFFLSEQWSHIGKGKPRTNMRLYLLDEVNKLEI